MIPRLVDIGLGWAGTGPAGSASYPDRVIAVAVKVRVAGNPAMTCLYLAGPETSPSLSDEAGDGTGADPAP